MAGDETDRLAGETDLARLLAAMAPRLFAERYAFATLDAAHPISGDTFAIIREDEGTTLIAPSNSGEWARITLTVHSSLDAVGLTAAFATALADAGISANVIAGLYHDHIFVPWDRREHAMAALTALTGHTGYGATAAPSGTRS